MREKAPFTALVCLLMSYCAAAQPRAAAAEPPSPPDPTGIHLFESGPFPTTSFVALTPVAAAGGDVRMLAEADSGAREVGALPYGETSRVLDVARSSSGAVWYRVCSDSPPVLGWVPSASVAFAGERGRWWQLRKALSRAVDGDPESAAAMLEDMPGVVVFEGAPPGVLACRVEGEGRSEYADMVAGPWGINSHLCNHMGTDAGASAGGRFLASGADGTSTVRGPLVLFDLQTGAARTAGGATVDNSGWLGGDMMLVETAELQDADLHAGIFGLDWINRSYMAGPGLMRRNIILLQGRSAWMLLPEDSRYNYRLEGHAEFEDGLLSFHVEASPNVVPADHGLETLEDLEDWVNDAGGWQVVCPVEEFRVTVDTGEMLMLEVSPVTAGR